MSPLSESFEFIIGLPDIDSLTLKFKDKTEQWEKHRQGLRQSAEESRKSRGFKL